MVVVRTRSELMITSGDNTHRTLYVHILNKAEEHCTSMNSIVIISMGGIVPSDSIGGNTMSGTLVMHAGGSVHHTSNSCVHFSTGTYILLGGTNRLEKDHVFNPITHRLHTTGVGIMSLTPRMLWFLEGGMVDGLRVGGNSAICIGTNRSGNGANGILGVFIRGRHTVIRNLGVMSGDRGPDTGGPRKKVIGRRTTVRVSGLGIMSPGANGPAHVNEGLGTSNGSMHCTGGSKRRVGW